MKIPDNKVLWTPDTAKITNIDRFREKVNAEHDLTLSTYAELHQWSCDYIDLFWKAMWEFSEIVSSVPFDRVVDTSLSMDQIPVWFEGARMNYAENLLKWNDDKVAVIGYGEGQSIKKITYAQLKTKVAYFAASLKSHGIVKGDRVAGYIPNCVEAVVAMLATASIGAVWTGTSPDFGVSGVLDRFAQVAPKLLISVNAVHYNGKVHDHLAKLKQVVSGLESLTKIVVIPFVTTSTFDCADICPIAETWQSFLGATVDDTNADAAPKLEFEQLPFNHPLYVMYSSGTTGKPKCMVHSAGGCLIKHNEEHLLQSDMGREDVLFYYSTTGWMMWNWLMGGLGVGGTIVCYDGSPSKPSVYSLFDFADEIGITILGTSAKWLAWNMDNGVKPREHNKLTTLRAVLSTGSPLTPETFEYVYKDIKEDLLLGSISGGTDICSCFMGSNPTVPVVKGEIQTRHLGMAVQAWDDEGNQVFDTPGELVCVKPFPIMPVYFWNDKDGSKYRAAYFEKYPGVWAHGDYCQLSSSTGGMLMLGRSDGVLNPNGVRFGSSEVYTIMDGIAEVEDSLCVGQVFGKSEDERVVLFLKMNEQHEFSDEIVSKVKIAIRLALSPRHVPAFILETKEIPYTINGKKVEVAVKKILGYKEVKNHSALANAECLQFYEHIIQNVLVNV
eukprot:CFRG4677T1